MKKVLIFLFAWLILALLSSGYARADEESIWLTTGMRSYHNNRAAERNENNTGIGIEYQLSKVNSIYIGEYKNSLYHNTDYIGWAWQPVERFGFKIGFLGIMATGYTRDGSIIVAPIPMASKEWGHFGINVVCIPTVVTAIQLKVKM